jgi:hypothetical protein
VLGSVIGIAAIVAGKLRQQPATTDVDEEIDDASDGLHFALGHVAIPFGPFLTAAALGYMLLHPYFIVQLR